MNRTSATDAIGAAVAGDDLARAVGLALDRVKQRPADIDARRLLIDVLVLGGDLERADRQADIVQKTAPDMALGMSLLRGRLRAAQARRGWFEDGAVPAFPGGPTERDELALKLGIAMRRDDDAETAAALAALAARSVSQGLLVDGEPASAFRDADDRVPHAFEVLCSDGSYMWVDFDRIDAIAFEPAATLRDLVWRRAKLSLDDGSQTELVVCATYHGAGETDAQKLGRSTDWIEGPGGVFVGRGQKSYMRGDDVIDALEINTLRRR